MIRMTKKNICIIHKYARHIWKLHCHEETYHGISIGYVKADGISIYFPHIGIINEQGGRKRSMHEFDNVNSVYF